MKRTSRSIESEKEFKDAVEQFNKEHNRNIVVTGEYHKATEKVQFYEKSVINGKIYEEYWTQTPSGFKNGYEGNPLFKQGKEFTQDRWDVEFIKACQTYFPNRNISYTESYKDIKTPITFTEKTNDGQQSTITTWKQRPDSFLRGNEGNPDYKYEKKKLFEQNRKELRTPKLWPVYFEEALKEYFPGRHIECRSECTDLARTKLLFYEKTEKYGKMYDVTWEERPDQFLKGKEGNPLITSKAPYTQQRWDIEFEHTVETKFSGRRIKCLDSYKDGRTPLTFSEETEKYGKFYNVTWKQNPHEFIAGHEGNPLLKANGEKYTQQRWEIEFDHACDIYYKNRSIDCLSKYADYYTEMEFNETMVLQNGKTEDVHWFQSPSNFLRGFSGNPYDKKKGNTSFLQEFLYDILSQYFIPKGYSVSNRDTSLFKNYNGNPMELDIVVYDENQNPKMALEPGAWFRHQKSVQYDIDKLSICNDNDLYCLLIYFAVQDKTEVLETESIKNYKSENPDVQDNIWVYSNQFGYPTCPKEKKDLTNLVDALGRLMNVENLASQPEVNVDTAIQHANDNMIKNRKKLLKSIPEKFEEIVNTKKDEMKNMDRTPVD